MQTNTFIEGDNLAVLSGFSDGSFDLIYIDPPYNTGNGFAYVDRHSDWVGMMRPRLLEARRVLAESGAIAVSIDDNEQASLRLLMDEVFGRGNFLAQVVVNLNPKGRQLGRGFATSHEYLLVFARSASVCALEASSASLVDEADFPYLQGDRRYRHLPLRNTNKRFNPISAPTLHFAIWGSPDSGRVSVEPFEGAVEIKPVFGDGAPAVWRWSAPLISARAEDLVCRRITGVLGERVDVFQKDWLETAHGGGPRRKKMRTIWLASEVGSTDSAVAELKAMCGHIFETPKPTGLILRLLDTMPSDCRVLDFFAGSGTTGHAVALANATDGGTRTCVSVDVGVPVRAGSRAATAGLATVADITRTRLRAVDATIGGGLEERFCGPIGDAGDGVT
ncbi:site-specific DNA-methyltransferase [Nocardioides sp. Kera G14]|uniref:site-specific DNA-methyltransferase n=1 Tax=Nocardioides sp. Kera G14 TaxID=2884264 RepID=UPI001D12F899|nr:site-specific DNA-methyltransferase [Nocardioides sp. Kera G14]UDY23079.1 site-specific DNA-methyltransferase [Nocardioides sp. Kera G14]